jgi:hypothetical protein
MFYFKYKGQPIKVEYYSVLFGGFDINEWKGSVTPNCKLSSTSILIPSLTEQAKKAIIDSLAQIKADQVVFKDVIFKYMRANADSLGIQIDPERGEPIVLVNWLLKPKVPKPDPKNPNKDLTPFFGIGASLRADKGEKDGRNQKILSTVILNGKSLVGVTRGELNTILQGKKAGGNKEGPSNRFLQYMTGEPRGFLNNMGVFYLSCGTTIARLQQMAGTGEISPEEMEKIVDETADIFAKMGIATGTIDQDPAADDDASAPVASTSSANLAFSLPGFGEFKEVETPLPSQTASTSSTQKT